MVKTDTTLNRLLDLATSLFGLLKDEDQKIVFAESCTGGLMSAFMTKISGSSQVFCGSQVVYRPDSKIKWLHINGDLIANHTAESSEVSKSLCENVLKNTPEANWAISIVGHVENSKNFVLITIMRRSKKNNFKTKLFLKHDLKCGDRTSRQEEAVEVAFSHAYRTIYKKLHKAK